MSKMIEWTVRQVDRRGNSVYVSNRQVYALSRIYSSHILNMVIIHDVRQPCGPLTLVPATCYINIMLLIIGAHNVTLDLWPVLHNVQLMYTTCVQRLLSTSPRDSIINTQ